MINYSETYDKYWQRPDRSGESSFTDPAALARQIQTTCGPGKILDVGCGMGSLVRELLAQGADAYGLDVSEIAVAHNSKLTPGRFFAGSALNLPFPDEYFETIVCTDCLDHLTPTDVEYALREMRRVCRRNVFLYVATGPDRDGHWHLTIQKRQWWEEVAFSNGFRKHPFYYAISPFQSLEVEGNSIAIPLEKLRTAAATQFPLSYLMKQRDLHMDMSRESGRRSDAHMARYQVASQYVRDGDTILDAACGMGYGSHMLSCQTTAKRVIGADLDIEGVHYANAVFGDSSERLSFQVADAQNLDFLQDNSIDFFVSFETLEHVPNPDRLISEANRVLRPGGRFIVSVPNLWVNEHGVDPNPHHLHVYDWKRLSAEIQSQFLIETAFAQTAGGGMKLNAHPRTMIEFCPQKSPPAEAEWWLIVGMKDAVGSKKVPYKETAFIWNDERPNTIAFSRDYENPWLVRSLITIGWRMKNTRQLRDIANRVLDLSSQSSPDAGAALCVLAYGVLNGDDQGAKDGIQSKIETFLASSAETATSTRWAISLSYVNALLFLQSGNREEALRSFCTCMAFDPLAYSPLIATKCVDACRMAGKLCYESNDMQAAKKYWMRGIAIAENAMKGNWRDIYGSTDSPFSFGLREAAQVLDHASRCADGLHHLSFGAPTRGVPDVGSYASRIEAADLQLTKTTSDYAALRGSVGVRLQHAFENEAKPLRKFARICYLLALLFLPSKLKKILSPLANRLRQRFV